MALRVRAPTKASKAVKQQATIRSRSFGTAAAPASGTRVPHKMTVQKNGQILVEFAKNPYKTHKLDSNPGNTVTTSKEELLKFFREMSLWRRVEFNASNLYKSRLIRGFLHLYNGQEAIVAGLESVLTKEDHVITAYRDHAHYMGRGGSAYEVMAELMGKKDGCSGGKGGSMHMYKADGNFHGGNGIVGAQVPVGAGLALALKYQGKPNVSVSFYGDGAANQGQLFEAYNMAHLWKLPAIFVCENNKYGMGTSMQRSSASTDYYTRGDYLPGLHIDAMDVLAVKRGVQFAAEHAKTKGPIVLEMETYRYMGHSMSDAEGYRTRDDVNRVKEERDPIDKVKNWLIDNKLADDAQLKGIEKEVKAEVDEATEKAKAAAWPELKDLWTDVYQNKPYYVRATDLPASVVVE